MQETLDDVLLAAGDQMIDRAKEAGNFINFTAYVHNGRVNLDMCSWEFDAEEMLAVASLVVQQLSQERSKILSRDSVKPLPEAESLQHLLKSKLKLPVVAEEGGLDESS